MDNLEETNEGISMEYPEKPMVITEDVRSYLYDISKWTRFLSIIGFVFTALITFFCLWFKCLCGNAGLDESGKSNGGNGVGLFNSVFPGDGTIELLPEFTDV